MNEFKDFAESTIDNCPILTNQQIVDHVTAGDLKPVLLHCYRLASFLTTTIRSSVPEGIDDGDWQDAVQECMALSPRIIELWKLDVKFNSYVGGAYKRIMRDYLWSVAKGGMDYSRGSAQVTVQLFEAGTEDTPLSEGTDEYAMKNFDVFTADDPGFGLRDPLDEAIAEQEATRALLAINTREPTQTARSAKTLRIRNELGRI